MSEYNLTIFDLEEGKYYKREAGSPDTIFKFSQKTLFFRHIRHSVRWDNGVTVTVNHDRFAEIPPPIKKVKKTISCWANIYKGIGDSIQMTLHTAKKYANEKATSTRLRCIELKGEYVYEEVEE